MRRMVLGAGRRLRRGRAELVMAKANASQMKRARAASRSTERRMFSQAVNTESLRRDIARDSGNKGEISVYGRTDTRPRGGWMERQGREGLA